MKWIKVHFYNPYTRKELTMELSETTPISALTPLLQREGFADHRKAGWRYIYQEHLCGMNHALADYVPEDAEEIRLDLFGYSQVLV